MNNDTRCRYFFKFFKNDEAFWSGYLLHDEAWCLLNEAWKVFANNKNGIKVHYELEKGNINNKSDNYENLLLEFKISKLY